MAERNMHKVLVALDLDIANKLKLYKFAYQISNANRRGVSHIS